jgi:hypothetical protein
MIQLFKMAQKEAFSEDWNNLHRNGRVSKHSKLRQHQPVLAGDGLIRVNSRLKFAKWMDFKTIKPIILPGDHPLVIMYMEYVHGEVLEHVGGTSYTLGELNQNVWVIQGRTQLNKIIRKCVSCLRRRGTAVRPEIARIKSSGSRELHRSV